MLVAAVIILAGVVVVASGRGGEMAPEYPDYPPIDLGPVTAADVVMMRPPSAAWGYNMRITDEALEAIARAVTERDVRISALEQEVSDLRGQAGEHPLEARPAIPDPASGPAAGEDTIPAWPLRDEAAAGEPGPQGAPYGAPAHEESPYETTGYADAGPEEPAYEAAAHGQPPHETASYADAAHEEPAHEEPAHEEPAHEEPAHEEPAHEEPAHPEAGQDPAWGTSQHATWEAPAQPSVWKPAQPYEQAHGDDVDDRGSGPVTDPDLPRVPADAADLSRPPAFWDTAAPSSATPPSAAPPAASRVSGDEPDGTWDERPHQTLVWGAAHQRAKATRIQEQDEADQGAAREDAARLDEESQDGPGPADREEARQPAGSEQDHE